jgi:hypothetical protein
VAGSSKVSNKRGLGNEATNEGLYQNGIGITDNPISPKL